MNRLQNCIIELRKLSSEQERYMVYLSANHQQDYAQSAGEEMDVLNDAIFFLSEYQITLNAFQIIGNHLALDKDGD